MLTSYGEIMHSTQNPFAFRKPITVDSLDELFAHHRGLTGGWAMTATPPEPEPPTPPAPPAPPEPPPSYTPPASQSDLDRIIGERVARERAKYADYDDMKKKAAEHDKAVEAARTDQEKAVEAARKEGETTATEKSNVRLVSAEARAIAAEVKFRNPAAAVKLLDLGDVKVADDGTVDADAIRAKLTKLAETDAYLVDDGKKPMPKQDPTQGGDGKGGEKGRLTELSGEDLYNRLHPKKAS